MYTVELCLFIEYHQELIWSSMEKYPRRQRHKTVTGVTTKQTRESGRLMSDKNIKEQHRNHGCRIFYPFESTKRRQSCFSHWPAETDLSITITEEDAQRERWRNRVVFEGDDYSEASRCVFLGHAPTQVDRYTDRADPSRSLEALHHNDDVSSIWRCRSLKRICVSDIEYISPTTVHK